MLPVGQTARAFSIEERVRGIEPPCAAWEAAVLPLNYTRNRIFDFRFSIADCNPNKARAQNRLPLQARQNRSLPGNYVVRCGASILVGRAHATQLVFTQRQCDDS